MHSPERHLDPTSTSTASNFWYVISVGNSSNKEYEILC